MELQTRLSSPALVIFRNGAGRMEMAGVEVLAAPTGHSVALNSPVPIEAGRRLTLRGLDPTIADAWSISTSAHCEPDGDRWRIGLTRAAAVLSAAA